MPFCTTDGTHRNLKNNCSQIITFFNSKFWRKRLVNELFIYLMLERHVFIFFIIKQWGSKAVPWAKLQRTWRFKTMSVPWAKLQRTWRFKTMSNRVPTTKRLPVPRSYINFILTSSREISIEFQLIKTQTSVYPTHERELGTRIKGEFGTTTGPRSIITVWIFFKYLKSILIQGEGTYSIVQK